MGKSKKKTAARTPEAFIEGLLPRVKKQLERRREAKDREQDILKSRHECSRLYQTLLNGKADGVVATLLPEQVNGHLESVQFRLTVDGRTEELELFARSYRSSLDGDGKLKRDTSPVIERFIERVLMPSN